MSLGESSYAILAACGARDFSLRGPMRFIDRDEVARRLTYDVCIPIVREAMIALSRGGTKQVLRSIISLSEGRLFGIMPGAMASQGPFGAKLISVFHGNFARGIQSHQGVVVLFDPESGAPVCVLHAGEITAIRTAAASAVATEALARKESRWMALLGYGEQAHTKNEYLNGTASSMEDRRLFATHKYKIETVIGKNHHLFSTAIISFEPLVQGERVLKFELLPNLRVSQVFDDKGQNLNFIQEDRKQDGSFYAILPAAPSMGQETSITIEYAGDKVIESAGGGSYYVQARSSWYPNLNGFGERAVYDLTFKVPKKYKLISVGELQQESIEQDVAVTHWVTPVPVAVAGFNYGEYKQFALNDGKDDKLGYKISGYYLTELPDSLSRYSILKTMAPRSMTEYALQQTRAQLEICNIYFGKSPYNSIYITEQPNFNFGQSWPYLVYLPISAYTDSTQRYMLFGGINNKFTGFVDEVTPHEVAHQWWGHAVGWASYHDQWLSEGFAEFSAGLFTQIAFGKDSHKDYLQFWDRLHDRIVEKNRYGVAPFEAGPVWMGLRLMSPKSEEAYQNVVYPKGAYILQMIRSIMYSPGDKQFIEMMHDFVESHKDRPATTESFQKAVERHMNKAMDLEGNGKMDWFFREWVYGTEIPKYDFEYQSAPADSGKVKVSMKITQSEVGKDFVMLVPVFADFGKGMLRIGQLPIVGNSSRTVDVILPTQPKKVALNAERDILQR